ncbi:MAG: sugar nucleotide-binding protein, partial [Sphingobacteriales bacterium]|nr:sugar nucleotide-binding protein [Sphingobacteriales bacterium]
MEVWGGIECTINRVYDTYFDQLSYSGHYDRENDIALFKDLGIKKLRYPVLWEKHQPNKDVQIDWLDTEKKLNHLVQLGIEPIVGLVHHGSGPCYVQMQEESFSTGLAEYASKVANKFPFIRYYTPINEPLTTARFCGLYGLWHPHKRDDASFIQILISECKATVLAMQAIRKVNPQAKLVQTEDLGKTHSTSNLSYQANFENYRRWLGFDLLCGLVDNTHKLYKYLIKNGATESQLNFFLENPCPPDILGFNHYLTSERYLDHQFKNYPKHTVGGNKRHRYADVEAVRVANLKLSGPYNLLKEAWERYQLPLTITEVHLHCTREEQIRWLASIWKAANDLKNEGIDIRAVTFWALLGSFGWNRLLTKAKGDYESGVFDVTSGQPRSTALADVIKSFGTGESYTHPILNEKGWWERDERLLYNLPIMNGSNIISGFSSAPVLILGKTGTLGFAFSKKCDLRNIHYQLLDRNSLDITNIDQIESVIKHLKPWAVVNSAGYVRVDDAEDDAENCYRINTEGPSKLAAICLKYGVKLMMFSSDLVFDGHKDQLYVEKDIVHPLNVYGHSKALAEKEVLEINPNALVIRTSAFFGPYDQYNFVTNVLNTLKQGKQFQAIDDVLISPTYVPDLVNASLNLLLDNESGIWHLSNEGVLSWADLAIDVASRGKFSLKH